MAFVDQHRERFGVEPICRALQIAPSTYWARQARRRQPAARTLSERQVLAEIRRIHEQSRGLYGARKVFWQLRREGIAVARCTVERLMRAHGLQGVGLASADTRRSLTGRPSGRGTWSIATSPPAPQTSLGWPTSPTS
jgi:putative transposase